MLAKDALFARLAEGQAARISVITPNRRLAQTLLADFDAYQIGRGLSVWEAADILPYGAFVERLWEDALYSEAGGRLPLLLTPAQEQAIWEDILRGSDLLSVARTASQCRDAWRLRHAWRIPPGGGTEDAAAFAAWAETYRRRTEGEVDSARLPDVVAGFLDHVKAPKLLVAYAFDIVPPQMREFFARFDLDECKPQAVDGEAGKQAFRSAREELAQAAAWARARLEHGYQRIGVVVPDLAKRRSEVVRVFSRVMQPAYNLPGASKQPMPFNVSLGAPLADYPMVDCALSLIRISFQEIDFGAASRLVRSPFVAGAESEMNARARLDTRLRGDLGATVSLPKLIASIEHCPVLRAALENVFRLKGEGRQSPGAWARHFSALLEAAGFPGERTLDSDEFQTRAKWHETLGELAKLDRISREEGIELAHARLAHLCRDTLFQPAHSTNGPAAPVQVLGVLESAGLRFDCLWVTGLTDETWPMDARPNPFIPVALQKRAGIPQAAAETSAALDRRLTEEWLASAPEVIVSFPAKDKDRDLAPSPLIAGIPEAAVDVPEYRRYRDVLFSKKVIATLQDGNGPRVAPGPVRGGTRVLADQAACPFRAFARWRLAAESLETPADGPDAADRGRLLHALMREIWAQLRSSAALHEENLVPVIERAAATAVREAGLDGRFAELERVRLVKLADEWLALEKNRKPFEVAFTEHPRTLAVAGLEFSSRIDRMDRLVEGERGYVLIDYKTGGRVTPKDWEPPRPDDPQLPLYAVAAPEDLAAVAFAKLRPGDMRFTGFAKARDLVPRVRPALNWSALLAEWKKEADSLGSAFAAGDAAVDPKRDLKTCLRCDLQTLCRVYEKFNVLEEIEDEESGE
jgi:ATP-dependent helicase/nuclease subunit B